MEDEALGPSRERVQAEALQRGSLPCASSYRPSVPASDIIFESVELVAVTCGFVGRQDEHVATIKGRKVKVQFSHQTLASNPLDIENMRSDPVRGLRTVHLGTEKTTGDRYVLLILKSCSQTGSCAVTLPCQMCVFMYNIHIH